MRVWYGIGIAVLSLTLVTACSRNDQADSSANVAPSPASTVATAMPSQQDRAAAENVTRRFIQAANAGNVAAAAATFAENASFNNAGSVYRSRNQIRDNFIAPEIVQKNGRHQTTDSRWDGQRYVVNYQFTSDDGGQHDLSYSYLVRNSLIQDVVLTYNTGQMSNN